MQAKTNTKDQKNVRKSIAISFLGSDGSGKSTIISGLLKLELPFERNNYFHLKPIRKKEDVVETVVDNPHAARPFSTLKSYAELLFFIFQYNSGWYKNVIPLK